MPFLIISWYLLVFCVRYTVESHITFTWYNYFRSYFVYDLRQEPPQVVNCLVRSTAD